MKLFKKKSIIEEEIEEEKQEFNEENYTIVQKKCENCGASLKVNRETLECKCDFCRTEYYVKENELTDELIITGQIVKIKIRGEEKKFYIADDTFHKIYSSAGRNMKGQLVSNLVANKEKLTLIEI